MDKINEVFLMRQLIKNHTRGQATLRKYSFASTWSLVRTDICLGKVRELVFRHFFPKEKVPGILLTQFKNKQKNLVIKKKSVT